MYSEPRVLSKVPEASGLSPLDPSLPKIDPQALRAKNYPTPGIYAIEPGSYMDFSPLRANTTVANGAMTSRIHTGEPIPALAAYQKMNKKVISQESVTSRSQIKPQPNKGQISKPNVVAPLPKSTNTSTLPQLPPTLILHQRNFSTKIPSPPVSRKLQSQNRKKTVSRGKRRDESTIDRPIDNVMEQLTKIEDPLKLVELLVGREDLGFFYMATRNKNRNVNRSVNPYNLRIVSWENVDHADYRTISSKGVTQFREGEEMDFTPLADWKREYYNYHHLINIKIFSKFQLWKAFSTWRRNVRRGIIHHRKKSLQDKLFFLNPDLSPALLTVSNECHAICKTQNLSCWQENKIYSKQAFLDEQYQQMSQVSFTLAKFREAIKFFVIKACQRVLLRNMFIPDEVFRVTPPELTGLSEEVLNIYETGLQKQEYCGPPEERNAPLDIQEKSLYTEQAAKRVLCHRLSRFVRLTDYMILSALHGLSFNSLNSLLCMLNDCVLLAFTPKDLMAELSERLRQERERRELGETAEEEEDVIEADTSVKPVFKTSLRLEGSTLFSDPPVDEFQQLIEEIGQRFKDSVLAMPRLIIDRIFVSYVRPIINKRREEGPPDPPSLEIILEDDPKIEELLIRMRDTMGQAFEKVHEYARMWEPFRVYFEENQKMDLKQLAEEEHDVEFFATSLEKYDRQYYLAEKCPEKMTVGAFMVDTRELKKQLKPSTMRCLEVIHQILPKMAKERLDHLIEFAQDANARLVNVPSTTKEYVENISFINSVQLQMTSIDDDTLVVRELYDLIQRFVVPCDAEDMATYMTLEPGMASLRTTIDKSVSELEKKKNEFRTYLENDITELGKEVREVKRKADQPMILDPNSEPQEITLCLSNLQQRMDSLNDMAQEYRSYQKKFQMELTRFDELEETHAELKLKHTLWNVQSEFDTVSEEWGQTKLCDIQPDTMSSQVTRYVKTTFQLDKGLPPNQIVPQLKAKVSRMKDKMPTITDLCNPNLKQRHWAQLSALVNKEMKPDLLTIQDLDEMAIFGIAEQVQEISGQASSEANLSNMLQMVEDTWKKTEFFVLNHRDTKDVFILGGTEDVQIALDDSLVQISTILGSRHVGPIKPKVEDMHNQLILFSETLDAWLDCQHQWLYLESIFTAPDIQRQLPEEAKDFATVDKSWKEIMRDVKKLPKALRACTAPGRLEAFQQNNQLLEKIQKCLEEYLETKRLSFPRFYFLSNDELLEILSQTRNPQAVQPHLRKCFDAISKLDFAKTKNEMGEEVFTTDILAMLSPEGERVPSRRA
ncbi:Dynein heavy chain 6, axonemal-like [Oopsacas minuta]|uniref:Dynein heavy chain 6, axonemal-like n=1 Tax=Oopsacas minuta TaxID=111878 RepID=A0AAV7JJQ6_9METZ|nr:Dynein heavy chain 6, axonemal-like [Oopsacas minuta]